MIEDESNDGYVMVRFGTVVGTSGGIGIHSEPSSDYFVILDVTS